MGNTILTRNVFVEIALQELLNTCSCKNICVVDIDSYHSLTELLQAMQDSGLKPDQKIYLLNGVSVYSKMLTPVAAFHLCDSPAHIKDVMVKEKTCDYAYVTKHIMRFRGLSMMTLKEKKIAYALVAYKDVPSMARAMDSNHKTIYSRVRIMADKLNLRDIGQVRKFILSEVSAANN